MTKNSIQVIAIRFFIVVNFCNYNESVIDLIQFPLDLGQVDNLDRNKQLKQLGERVRSIRSEKGITQTQLAYKIGKDQPSINRLEMGNINPSYLYLLEVCEGLEVSIEELLK